MNLIVNGHPQTSADGLSLTGLLEQLHLDPQRVAVELNQQVILRENFGTTDLNDGDRLELVQFVGGG